MLLRFLILAFVLMTTSTFAQTPPIETGVSQSLAKWRSANYSDVRYKLNITLEKGAPLMKGDIEIRVNLTDEGAKNDLILDWRTTQFANDKDKPYVGISQVNDTMMGKSQSSNDKSLFWVENEHLIVEKQFLKKGENIIKVYFASPIKTSGAAITRYVDKEDNAEYVYSLFVPSDASTAFPVFDQPDLKARFTLTIHTKTHWKVISNTEIEGEQVLINEDGTLNDRPVSPPEFTYFFKETKPISTYVFAFAAGGFAEFDECEVLKQKGFRCLDVLNKEGVKQPKLETKIYVRKSQAEKFKKEAAEVFRLNREGVKFLESWFDYKFPFPKYDLVLIPEFPFGGMEHAGATFLREDRVIFPTEPTKNDYITRANVIFHEAAHQWFGDTVTMKWFDDLWLKEGFAEFMAYKTLAKVMPEYNAWKIFYERNKQAAYLTDVTRGTTPIYQEIPNLSSAKSAYGNIVYRKAPSFLRQTEFYLGEDKFQTAVRQFLKKHEFANAEWTDLVKEFELATKKDLKDWGESWIKQLGLPVIQLTRKEEKSGINYGFNLTERDVQGNSNSWYLKFKVLEVFEDGNRGLSDIEFYRTSPKSVSTRTPLDKFLPTSSAGIERYHENRKTNFIFPNYQDYGYGIFLLDEKSRAYVLNNISSEKDDFLRSMMWGSLWDSLRFYELTPEDYVKLVIKNINVETDESTIQFLLGRVSTAMNYYLSDAQRDELTPQIEKLLIEKLETAPSVGQKITYFRALQSIGASEQTKHIFKDLLTGKSKLKDVELKTKDKFDLVTRLIILGDKDSLNLLAELEKTETNDAAKRYAYAARAGIATKENKLKYWKDFTENKEISESWIESAFAVWNTPKHAELTLPYLEKSLAELPNLKKNRKIFFVNGWLSAFIGGQKSAEALSIVNKFLADNPNLDRDLRLKILENADNLERAVKIRAKFAGK